MKYAVAIYFCFIFKLTGAKILWPQSYTLKGILTAPEAGVVEPYQVWYDGEAKRSRVDFYDGMDKLYRQYDAENAVYQYFKIHPETTNQLTNEDVCDVMEFDSMTAMYDQSNYLPVMDFQFQYSEMINGTKAEKWVKSKKVDEQYNAHLNYNVWVRFEDGKKTAIPLRYDFEMRTDEVVVDYLRHDYTDFVEGKPDSTKLELPLKPKCRDEKISMEEPLDPLMEYVEPNIQEARIHDAFDRFKLKHNKSYVGEEHSMRLNIFKNNFRYINSVNRQHRSFSLALNHLADLTERELSVFMGTVLRCGYSGNDKCDDVTNDDDDDIADDDEVEDEVEEPSKSTSFDWRDYGAITPVKDQTGMCGACYAFTTAAVVESSVYIARGCRNNSLHELSEQVILDCSWGSSSSSDQGCSGGDYVYAFAWAKDHGIPTKKEYGPYLAMEGRCHVDDMKKVVPVPSYSKLPKKNQVIKKALRKQGPLAAAIDAKPRSFTFYSKGVYNDQKCRSEPSQRTHAITVIGYGKKGDKKYWILKNSFGTKWGEDGFMKIDVEDNMCGVKNRLYGVNYKYNKSKVQKCFDKK